MGSRDYRDLVVWQRGMELVVEIYGATKSFPKSETYGLTSQIQRAAVSVPANIAEGQGRGHLKAFLNHLSISNGSLMEVETLIQIALRLGYIDKNTIKPLISRIEETKRLLNGLRNSLNKQKPN